MGRVISLRLLGLVLLLAGCGEQAGIPQPDPLPRVSLIKTTSPSPAVAPVNLVGLPGCVAGPGTVTLEYQATRVSGPAGSAGSFALTIAAPAGAEILVRYNQSPPATLQLPPALAGAPLPPGPIPGVPPITDLGGGRVRVRGRSGSGGGGILGVNPTLGEVVTTTAAADGTFSFEIAAGSGQQLRVYDDAQTLEGSWDLPVP